MSLDINDILSFEHHLTIAQTNQFYPDEDIYIIVASHSDVDSKYLARLFNRIAWQLRHQED